MIIAQNPHQHNHVSSTQRTGLAGEAYAAELLQERGYSVTVPADFNLPNTDLLINGLPVEVKLALPTLRRPQPGYTRIRWQFNLGNVPTDDRVYLIIAQDAAGERWPYIVPSAVLINRPHIQLTSHPTQYRGFIAPFLHAWTVIDYLLTRQYQNAGQISLYGME
jgi:hypothetical protein